MLFVFKSLIFAYQCRNHFVGVYFMHLLNQVTTLRPMAQLSKTTRRWAIASLAAVICFMIDYFWLLVS
jgi:hypothetical protein